MSVRLSRLSLFAVLCAVVSFAWSAVVRAESVADCDCCCPSGLYATITAPKSFSEPFLPNERKIKVRPEGFAKEIEARVLWQKNKEAPLAVLMLGLTSRSKDTFSQLWKSYLLDAGCHVLTFDSVFSPDFSKRSMHGASGYLPEEGRVAASVIADFLKSPEAKGRCTKVMLLGTSYGGDIALECAKLSRDGKLPYAVDRVLAFSPPVNLERAAHFLDQCYLVDLHKFGLMDLLPLRDAGPINNAGAKVPFSDDMMRAGIGYIFHGDIKGVASKNYSMYGREIGASAPDSNAVTFRDYVEGVAYPYWKAKGKVSSAGDLWSAGDLSQLMAQTPENCKVVLAQDDPLNEAGAAQALAGQYGSRVQVLPAGGHLGYCGSNWVKNRVKTWITQ